MAVLEPRPAFEAAVTARIGSLGENAPEAWLDNFLAALDTLRRDTAFLPEAAPSVKQARRHPDARADLLVLGVETQCRDIGSGPKA
jgi:hypothetical protein